MNKYRACQLAALSLLSIALATNALRAHDSGENITRLARTYLATLTAAQKATAVLTYETPQRVGWHFIPKESRKGLQIKDMTPAQREAAFELLRGTLSQVGYGKARKIMALEAILHELEKAQRNGPIRDPERYYYTLFGDAQDHGRWGLSIEGHHVSLNFTVDHGKVISSTPTFLGSNPNIVQHTIPGAPEKGTRVLAREELLAFELLQSLDAAQRKVAIIAEQAPRDIRAPAEPQSPPYAQEGLAFGKLTAEQQKKLQTLIEEYAGNMPEDLARERLHAIEHAGYAQVYFAWTGADKPGIGHGYRVQGPTFVIELVNNQADVAGNPASHIHSVWRDPRGDFAIEAHREK